MAIKTRSQLIKERRKALTTSRQKAIKKARETYTSPKKEGITLEEQVKNYETRLENIGKDPEKVKDKRNPVEKFLGLEEDQNVLFDIFELLGRPQQAIFGAIDAAQKGKDIGKGAWEGFKGDKDTYGGELLRNAGMKDSKGVGLDDVLGFGLDLFADPADIALYASVPLTGGGTAPVVGAKIVGDVATAGKAAKAVNAATDVAKAGKQSKLVFRPFAKGGKSLNDLAFSALGKGAKKTLGIGDTALSKGLSKLDNMELNRLTKKAKRAGFENVDEYVKQFGLKTSDFGTKAGSYNAAKQGIRDTFNQASTSLGKLRKGQRLAEGQNELISTLTKPQLDALDNAANDLAKSRLGANATEDALKIEKNKVLEDFLNYWESGLLEGSGFKRNIKGKNVLNQIKKGYTFEGDAESVTKLKNLLDDISNESGQKISYTTDFAQDRFANEIAGLADDDRIRKEYLRKGNKLTIDEIGDLKAIKNNPELQKAFDEAGFKYDLRYTADEMDYLEKLAKDQDFVNFVENNKNVYQNLNRTIKEATNNQLDFTDIINNANYARRARGDIGDIDERIKTIDELLQSDDLTNVDKEGLMAARADFENIKERKTGSVNTWGSRKYNQPALITNRETQEKFSKGIQNIDDRISRLDDTRYASKIESWKAKKADLEELQQIVRTGTGDGIRGSVKAKNLTKQLDTIKNKLGKIDTKIEGTKTDLGKLVADLETALTKQNIEIMDTSLRKSIVNDYKRLGKLEEQGKILLQKNNNYSKMSAAEKAKFDKTFNKVNKQLDDVTMSLKKDKIMAENTISKKTSDTMKKTEKAIQKAQDLKEKALGYKNTRDTLISKESNITQILADMDTNISEKIKNLDYNIKYSPNEDAIIDKKLANLTKTQSILKAQESANLFDLNFKAGLEDFIKNAEYTNKSNRLFKDAIMMESFTEGNVFKKLSDLMPTEYKNFKSISGKKMAKKLEGIRNLILDETSTKFSKDALDDIIDTLKNGDVYYADPRIVNMFDVATKGDNSTKGLLNLVDWVNTKFKKFSTLSPGFQLRNITGNSFNMFLSGMSPKDIVKYDTKAVGVMNSMPDILKKVSEGTQLTAKEQKNFELIKQFYEGGFHQAGTKVQDLDKVKQSVQVGGKYNPINIASNLNMKANEYMDGLNRMSLLMYANEHPEYLKRLGAENPIQAVKYALMDPSNMSDVEQKVIKKLIPFYTFTKQNLMFQATNIGKNSGRYKRAMKALNASYDALPDDSYYDYQKDSMQIPLPFSDDNGNQLFLKANLPLSDLGEWMSNPVQRLTASATPLIKVPYEMVTGVDTFTGQESNKPAVERILTGLGLQNISTNLYKKYEAIINKYNGDIDDQQMWAELFRSIVQNNKQESVRNVGLYENLQEYQALVKQLKEEGTEVPTMTAINAANRVKLNNMKRKRASR